MVNRLTISDRAFPEAGPMPVPAHSRSAMTTNPNALPAHLQALTPPAQAMVVPLLRPWQARKGTTLFHQNDHPHSLFFLATGFVRYEVTQSDGKHLLLAFSKPGSCFCDLEIFAGSPALCSAVAHTAVTGWQMDADMAVKALDAVPGFASVITGHLAKVSRFQRLMYQASVLRAPHERLAIVLLWLSSTSDGQEDPDQPLLQISQAMLAQMLALSRQCISKHLQQWKDAGWIASHYRGLRVVDRPALAALLPES